MEKETKREKEGNIKDGFLGRNSRSVRKKAPNTSAFRPTEVLISGIRFEGSPTSQLGMTTGSNIAAECSTKIVRYGICLRPIFYS